MKGMVMADSQYFSPEIASMVRDLLYDSSDGGKNGDFTFLIKSCLNVAPSVDCKITDLCELEKYLGLIEFDSKEPRSEEGYAAYIKREQICRQELELVKTFTSAHNIMHMAPRFDYIWRQAFSKCLLLCSSFNESIDLYLHVEGCEEYECRLAGDLIDKFLLPIIERVNTFEEAISIGRELPRYQSAATYSLAHKCLELSQTPEEMRIAFEVILQGSEDEKAIIIKIAEYFQKTNSTEVG